MKSFDDEQAFVLFLRAKYPIIFESLKESKV